MRPFGRELLQDVLFGLLALVVVVVVAGVVGLLLMWFLNQTP